MSSERDRFAPVRAVADAVLYEGYVLYPYRASATKNQLRWQFGIVGPRPAFERGAGEDWRMHAECLLEADHDAIVHVRVRFLQAETRRGSDQPPWDEGVERHVDISGVRVSDIVTRAITVPFAFPAAHEDDRERNAIAGAVTLSAEDVDTAPPARRIRVAVENLGDCVADATRDDVTRASLIGTHILLAADHGRFVSLLEPPPWAEAVARQCDQHRCWPVLVGDVVLCSPIILYDQPAVAPESQGDFFDATEIDEMLSLRVMTLTDEEKREARATDARAAAIVDRVDAMDVDTLARLHGATRPAAITVGARVRLHPSRRADAQDMFLVGREATVAAVEHDFDGNVHVAVSLDDDVYGRHLYFAPEEVELVRAGS